MKSYLGNSAGHIAAGDAPSIPRVAPELHAELLAPADPAPKAKLYNTPEIFLERLASRDGLTSIAQFKMAEELWRQSGLGLSFREITERYEQALVARIAAAPEMTPMSKKSFQAAIAQGSVRPAATAAICLELALYYQIAPSVFPDKATAPKAIEYFNKALELALVPMQPRFDILKAVELFDLSKLIRGAPSAQALAQPLINRFELLKLAIDDGFCPPSLKIQDAIFTQMISAIRYVAALSGSEHRHELLGMRRILAAGMVAKLGTWLGPIKDEKAQELEYGSKNEEVAKLGASLYLARLCTFLDRLESSESVSSVTTQRLALMLFVNRHAVAAICGDGVLPNGIRADASMQDHFSDAQQSHARNILSVFARDFLSGFAHTERAAPPPRIPHLFSKDTARIDY